MKEVEVSGYGVPKRRKSVGRGLVQSQLVFTIVGFFLAMAVPYRGMAPFGLAFLARERKLSVRTFLNLTAVSFGCLAVCGRSDAVKYIAAGLIYIAVLFVLEKDVVLNGIAAGMISAGCLLISGLAVVWWTGFSLWSIVALIFEVGLVFAGAFVLGDCDRVLQRAQTAPETLEIKEKISLGAVVSLLVLSLKNLSIGTDFSVMDSVAALVILEIAAGCGATFSAGAGIILGGICGIDSNFFLPVLGTFGFCGLVSGALSHFGRVGTIFGIIVAAAALSLYNNGAMRAMLSIYEIMAATLIFALLPSGWSEEIKKIVRIDSTEKEAVAKIKENLGIKLKSVAASFGEMASTLEKLSDRKEAKNNHDIATVFDLATDRICKNCCKTDICWNKEFDFTYKGMLKMMKAMNEKGEADVCDADVRFRDRCLNLQELVSELNHQFDLHRVRCVWRSRLRESRELVGEQLSGMSQIISDLSKEIADSTSKIKFSASDLNSRFEEADIKVRDINISQDVNGRYKVELIMHSGYWKDKPKGEILRIIKETFESEVSIKDMLFEKGEFVKVEFAEAERFRVETDYAVRAASEQNGDNYRFSHINDGKYVIALSDGMGTGVRAARESEAILELLDSFLRAGFDSRMAVKFLNSVMLLKSDEEAFVTIDVCIIDLYTGMAEFIKTGAEPSFIMKGGFVDTVKAASLPVGVVADMEAEIASRVVGDGSTIVMMTDGIESKKSDGLLWVRDLIKEMCKKGGNVNLAEKILQASIEKNGGEVSDDMTVISVKLKKVG